MNDLSLFNELEQKIVGLVDALKSERDKNTDDNKNVIDFFDGVTVYSDGVFIK